jgi:hypothetical protein
VKQLSLALFRGGVAMIEFIFPHYRKVAAQPRNPAVLPGCQAISGTHQRFYL